MHSSEDEEERPVAMRRAPATRSELEKALETAQLQIGDLKSEKKRLMEEVGVLTAEVTALRKTKKGRTNAASTIPYADELKNLGKKFAVMEEPWLKTSVFRVPFDNNVIMDPLARFVDDESYDEGVIATLHEFIPSKHHDDMVNLSEFAKEFCKHLNDSRSTAVHSVNKAAPVIFDLPAHLFPRHHQRDKEPSLLRLLKPANSQSYPIFAPVLYPDLNVTNLKLIFRTPYIPKIIRAMLYGEGSLTGTGQILHKCVGKIWEVRRLTTSLVAWAGVVAKYIPSADTELRETGQKTKIEYSKDFRRFKAFIMSKSDEKWMQDTLAYIHKLVFAGINGPIIDANSEQRGHDYDDEYAAIMEEFDRINLDNNDADLPQPPSAPPSPSSTSPNHNQPQQPVTGDQNAIAGPSIPRTRRVALPAVTASESDAAGDEEGTGLVPGAARQTRGNSKKTKGKAKA